MKTAKTTTDQVAENSQPDCPPPGGGSWKWEGEWVENNPTDASQDQSEETA